MDKKFTIIDDQGDEHEFSRKYFQVLHSAGRALLQQAIRTYDHSPESVAYLVALDEAIQAGHLVLNTERSAADNYVELIYKIKELHADQARGILEREGLLTKDS